MIALDAAKVIGLDDVAKFSHLKSFRADEILYYEGESPKYLYFLESGFCKAYKMAADSEVFLYSARKGDLISDFNFDSLSACSNVKFLTDSVVLCVDFKRAKELLFSKYSLTLMGFILHRNEFLSAGLYNRIGFTAIQRVVKFILDDLPVLNSIQRIEVAKMVSLTPISLSRSLRYLKDRGVISIGCKKVSILDEDELVSLLP